MKRLLLFGLLIHGSLAAALQEVDALRSGFVLQAGSLPRLEWKFPAADGITLDEDGSLVIVQGRRTMKQPTPAISQKTSGGTRLVSAEWIIGPDSTVRLQLGSRDPTKALIFHPAAARPAEPLRLAGR